MYPYFWKYPYLSRPIFRIRTAIVYNNLSTCQPSNSNEQGFCDYVAPFEQSTNKPWKQKHNHLMFKPLYIRWDCLDVSQQNNQPKNHPRGGVDPIFWEGTTLIHLSEPGPWVGNPRYMMYFFEEQW